MLNNGTGNIRKYEKKLAFLNGLCYSCEQLFFERGVWRC